PGPFVTEDPTLEISEPHNQRNRWQGPFRRGHLDAVALRYAVGCAGGVDALALTHLDVAEQHSLGVCWAYRADGELVADLTAVAGRLGSADPGAAAGAGAGDALVRQEQLTRLLQRARPVYGGPAGRVPAGDWPSVVEQAVGAPVVLVSKGPTALDKESRNWGICDESNRTRLAAGGLAA
ncbi:MAG TPA: adenylosuccinate synthetase, partial [Streptosporangiaceae bacterium]